jgi:hypothetical protein
MANAIYPLYKQAVMSAGTDTSLNQNTAQDGPYCALVDTGVYTYNTAHQYVSPSLTGITGVDQRILSPVVTTAGTFDGTDLIFSAVSGATIEALVIYRHNGGATTSWKLVCYLDSGVTGLPVTPNGGDITVTWDATGIFTL